MKIQHLTIAALLASSAMIGAAQAETVLRWTSHGDALTLDPQGQNEGPTSTMNSQMYEPLVRRDAKMVLEAALAESWGPKGSNAWEFKLRKGVKFHDGSDFDAEDVVFSIARAQHKNSDFQEQVKSIR